MESLEDILDQQEDKEWIYCHVFRGVFLAPALRIGFSSPPKYSVDSLTRSKIIFSHFNFDLFPFIEEIEGQSTP